MSTPRRGLSFLALCMVAAALVLSVSAASAQAGEFRINGKTFQEAGVSEAGATGTLPEVNLSIEPGGLGVSIHCEGHDITEIRVLWGLFRYFRLETLGCTLIGAKCTINRDGPEEGPAGVILGKAEGEVVLHSGAIYLVFEGSEFSTVYLSGAKCTLPEETVIHGSFAFLLPKALVELVNQPIEDISVAEEELLGVGLFFGSHPLFLDAEEPGSVSLTAPHLGATFGAE